MEGSVTSDTTATNNGIRQNTEKSQGKISNSEKIFSERNTGENAKFSAQGTESKGKKFSDSQQITVDAEQAQPREYLEDDNNYPTNGVHWGTSAGIISESDAKIVWESISNIQKRGYNSYPTTVNGDHYIDTGDKLMIVDTDYKNPTVKTIFKFNDASETYMSIAK